MAGVLVDGVPAAVMMSELAVLPKCMSANRRVGKQKIMYNIEVSRMTKGRSACDATPLLANKKGTSFLMDNPHSSGMGAFAHPYASSVMPFSCSSVDMRAALVSEVA